MLVKAAVICVDRAIQLMSMQDPMVIDVEEDLPKLMPRQQLVCFNGLWLVLKFKNTVLNKSYNIIGNLPLNFGGSNLLLIFSNFSFLNFGHDVLKTLV
jgi:hypothetical protein